MAHSWTGTLVCRAKTVVCECIFQKQDAGLNTRVFFCAHRASSSRSSFSVLECFSFFFVVLDSALFDVE
jgi:hypothetical protein